MTSVRAGLSRSAQEVKTRREQYENYDARCVNFVRKDCFSTACMLIEAYEQSIVHSDGTNRDGRLVHENNLRQLP